MFMIAFVIIIADVILLITWQIFFHPRAVELLREVSLNVDLILILTNMSTRLRMYKVFLFKSRRHLCKGSISWESLTRVITQ